MPGAVFSLPKSSSSGFRREQPILRKTGQLFQLLQLYWLNQTKTRNSQQRKIEN